ncbi:MAG TPA: type II toxin-antitoxin system HicB family antitoxin [Aridibacter sp.]|nr:type II toxin-antitoxin system HicB family antitoxin [Aridibacter sp.]
MTGKRDNLETVDTGGYAAMISKQRGGGFLVEFPDLPGCLTEGATIEEALEEASEAMTGWLYAAIKAGEDLPASGNYPGGSYHLITPEIDVAVPLAIIRARLANGMTQQQVADAMGVSQQAYRKLEIPGKSNPTIRTLARLGEVLGIRLVMSNE